MGLDLYPYQSDFNEKIEETKQLVSAANAQVVFTVIQKRDAIDKTTVIGKGKVQEIKQIIEETEATTVLFNMELSGTQIRNLEKELEIKIIDRTMLILDIFASRAVTKEGKLQVKLAQLQYRLPRLSHHSPYLSRLGGGIGTRGPGETKLESDRRHINREIKATKKKIEVVNLDRKMARSKRARSNTPIVSLIGYTNAGKSSILNAMVSFSSTNAYVETKDMVFASLQPFTRRIDNPVQTFLMSDTVGFVSDLPTHLIAAFESSLEEIEYANIIIHVVDASSPQIDNQIKTVENILKQFDLSDKIVITYFNKMDKAPQPFFEPITQSDLVLKGSALDKGDMLDLFNHLIERMDKQ